MDRLPEWGTSGEGPVSEDSVERKGRGGVRWKIVVLHR